MFLYTVTNGKNVRIPIVSLDPFVLDYLRIEAYDEPPLCCEQYIRRSHIVRVNSRKATIQAIALDRRITARSRFVISELIDDVVIACHVSRANARVLVSKARKLIRVNQ